VSARGVFISGTDTNCGKTCVGQALARDARAAGKRVRILKPVETGCEERHGSRVPADALALAEAAGDDRPMASLCPFRLSLPAAPEIAARQEGVRIELEPLLQAFEATAADADLVLVEGAGGLLVPLAPGLDMAGLAEALGLPILVVARASLGTINHTRLTLEALRSRGLALCGVVFSHTEADLSAADRANLDLLLEDLPAPFRLELAHGSKSLGSDFDFAGFFDSLSER
jgi:dethiobiotin synthetase